MQVRCGYQSPHISHLGKLLGCDKSASAPYAEHIVLVFALLIDAHGHAVAFQFTGFDLTGLIFFDK